ncbi:unnamed protein product [Caenorhabditis sp. 36 PRJEB53466]|nr:unnamed protein product [Caenorhabditis sp. 36 PRJEB53466]
MGLFTRKGTTRKPSPSKNKKTAKKGASENNTIGGLSHEETTPKVSKKPRNPRGKETEEQQSTAASVKETKGKAKKGEKKAKGTTADAMLKALGGPKHAAAPEVPQTPPVKKQSPDADETPTLPALLPSREPLPSKEKLGKEGESKKGNIPPTSIKTAATQPLSVQSITDKWPGAGTAKVWMEKADFYVAKTEYEGLQRMIVDVDRECATWKANGKFNQSEDYPVLDSTLVKCPEMKEYVNISNMNVPLHRSVLVGQIPLAGTEETFWKGIFDLRVTNIHLLVGDEPVGFFPKRALDFVHYGTMFVNNRRVEQISGDDVYKFAIEVLPAGLSNSIICNVTMIKNWHLDSVHPKYSCVVKETIELSNVLTTSPSDEAALIMSPHGAGRAGFFVSLAVAVYQMDKKIEPNMAEIVKNIRAQRPKSVESFRQYASLYISMFYYIKRKSSKQDGDKKAVSDPNDPLIRKAVQLTNAFTQGLMAEVAANKGVSTMTMLT